MARGKLKLSVIDDYILLTKLHCNFSIWATLAGPNLADICLAAKDIAGQQLIFCKQIIFRLGLMDYAFNFLCNQLRAATTIKAGIMQKEAATANSVIADLKTLKQIKNRLCLIVKKFKFTTAEAAYLGV